jgi:hypothetical protein
MEKTMEKPEYREERKIVTVTANTADAFSNFRKIQSALCIFGGLGFYIWVPGRLPAFGNVGRYRKQPGLFRKNARKDGVAAPGFAGRKMEASGFGLKEKRRERHCPKNRRIMIWMSAA